MVWLTGADHSFHVLNSSGRTDADVLEEVATTVADWISPAKPPRNLTPSREGR
jgi:hypothetical protein